MKLMSASNVPKLGLGPKRKQFNLVLLKILNLSIILRLLRTLTREQFGNYQRF